MLRSVAGGAAGVGLLPNLRVCLVAGRIVATGGFLAACACAAPAAALVGVWPALHPGFTRGGVVAASRLLCHDTFSCWPATALRSLSQHRLKEYGVQVLRRVACVQDFFTAGRSDERSCSSMVRVRGVASLPVWRVVTVSISAVQVCLDRGYRMTDDGYWMTDTGWRKHCGGRRARHQEFSGARVERAAILSGPSDAQSTRAEPATLRPHPDGCARETPLAPLPLGWIDP